MLFLTFSNANIRYAKKKLKQKRYTTVKPLPTTQIVELINKIEFVDAVLDDNAETFIIYITNLSTPAIQVHLFCQTQIGLLLADKALIKVQSKYLDYVNDFLFHFITELSENISINKHTIILEEDKQLLYGLIYSLGLVKLETLKTYNETYLKTGFIQLKSLVGAFIFFT